MKVLITGGAGFIGYHLTLELLKYDYDVTLVDNFERGVEDECLKQLEKNSKVKFITLDLLNKCDIKEMDKDFDIIFHLAAIIGVQNVLNCPEVVLRDNIELLFNMIDFAKNQTKLKRFVFASTSEIYAGTLLNYEMEIPTPETTPLTLTPLDNPRTSYMLSKIYGEAVLNQSNIPFTIVRPHNFYGPRMGMSHVIPELLRKIWFNEGKDGLEVYSPTHKRTFCYIEDAVKMIRLLAENDASVAQAYNIGNQEREITMKEVAEIVIKTVKKPTKIIEMESTVGSPERRCPNMEKTFKCIGYKGKVSLEEGIEKTFQWYSEHIFNGREMGAK